jgi:putative tributyrin esterase
MENSELHAQDVVTGSYFSNALDRVQPYRALIPASIAPGEKLPLIVMLHGYDADSTAWLTQTRAAVHLRKYRVVAIFPEGGTGWYTNSFDGAARYEDDIVSDLQNEIVSRLPVRDPGPAWAIGGFSMGGYGAIKLALKHTQLFGTAFSHSGAVERMLKQDVHPVFGDPVTDAAFRKQECPLWLAEQVLCRFPFLRPNLFIDCGVSDKLLEENQRLSQHLDFLGYHHVYRELPGMHTWPYWNRAFRTVLPEVALAIGAECVV